MSFTLPRCPRLGPFQATFQPHHLTSRSTRPASRWVHNAASTKPSPASQSSKSRWLRIAIVTVAAGGIGAYFRSEQSSRSAILNPITFTQYELVSKTPVSSTSSIFNLRPIKQGQNTEIYEDAWQTGLWSVQFKQPQLQVGRDYTPLPPSSQPPETRSDFSTAESRAEDDETLRFLIRKDGEVSGYIHGLEPGSTVEMRGPQTDFELSPDVQEVLFIAGGTGIAPALQAAHNLFKCREGEPNIRLHVLWANRRREDCLGGHSDLPSHSTDGKWWSKLLATVAGSQPTESHLDDADKNYTVKQLEELKKLYPGKFTVDYFVDEESSLIKKESIMKFIDSGAEMPNNGPAKKKLILISGPDGFVSYLAGPKVWREGYEAQGPLLGIIRELNLKGWSIWKL